MNVDVGLFKDDYVDCREQFMLKAKNVGAEIGSVIHPLIKDIHGNDLAIDTAFIGNKKATHIFVILSGTHGLEGHTGSAIQSHFLANLPPLAKHIALLFVHSVNPYGFANLCRVNEDNVDINRNFVDKYSSSNNSVDLEDVLLQEDLQKIFTANAIGFKLIFKLFGGLIGLIVKYGMARVSNAATAGQYTFPKGLNYGGNSASWSNKSVRDIIKQHCQKAKKVVLLDWHTGLGGYAKPCYLCFNPTTSSAHKAATKWWGKDVLNESPIKSVGSGKPNYSGLLVTGLAEELGKNVDTVQVVIEFGTFSNLTMLRALVTDRWIRFFTDGIYSAKNLKIKTWLVEKFCPSDIVWRKKTLSSSLQIQLKTLQGLANWSVDEKAD